MLLHSNALNEKVKLKVNMISDWTINENMTNQEDCVNVSISRNGGNKDLLVKQGEKGRTELAILLKIVIGKPITKGKY